MKYKYLQIVLYKSVFMHIVNLILHTTGFVIV